MIAGLPLFLVLTCPWFIVVSMRNPGFASFFFVHEHFTRFLTTVHQRVEPWWYFLPLLLLGVLPWIAPASRAVAGAWREAPAPDSGFKPRRFLAVFAGVTLLFFSASGSKLAPYILPMFPVLAALAGAQAAEPVRLAAVAARVGKHRVTYEPNLSGVPDPSGLQLRVDGTLTTLTEGPAGKPLLAPNDLIVDAKGGIYFTDPGPRPVVPGRPTYGHLEQ